jgi:DNA-binding LacI/PurR family transcriptional regulator
MRRPATMKDIGDAAGVAQSTVSRILNDAPGLIRVTEETRARVLAIATEIGYQPHPFARALRGAPSMLLGAVVRDISDPFFAPAIEALSIAAKERGYSVVLGHARDTPDEALALTAVLEARQCDAIVLLGDLGGPRLVEDLHKSQVRVVALWHGSQQRRHGFPTVGVDNRAGIRAALTHVSSLGHRRIAFVGGESHGDLRERKAAYIEYLCEAAIKQPDGYIRDVPNTVPGGQMALSALLTLPRRPTAIIAATDILAMGVIHAAFEGGVAVPEQLSIVGFDDIALAAATVPSLTTLQMPTTEIVSAGVELAIGEADTSDGMEDAPYLVFQPRLIVRRSTARVAHALPRRLTGPTRPSTTIERR